MTNLIVAKISAALLGLALLIILGFSAGRSWTWGTMDEPGLAMLGRQIQLAPSLGEKLRLLFPGGQFDVEGRFRPALTPYLRIRFGMLKTATAQHVVQFLFVIATLYVWWRIAIRLGVEKPAIPLGLLAMLYFGPWTIGTIGFPTIQEPPLLLFMSIGIWAAIEASKQRSARSLVVVIGSVFLALCFKETAVALVPAVSIALGYPRNSKVLYAGWTLLIAVMILYPVAVTLWVKTGYSSSYRFSLELVLSRLIETSKSFAWSYKFAIPFVMIGIPLRWRRRQFDQFDAICAAGALGYLGVLLPWTSEITYYQGPIAPFIGFLAGRGVWSLLESTRGKIRMAAQGLVLGACILMTASIGKQMKGVSDFNMGLRFIEEYLADNLKGEKVYINGEEASVTVPTAMTWRTGRAFDPFVFATPSTAIKGPAYLALIDDRVRYLPPVIPESAQLIKNYGRWSLYRVP